MNETDKEKKRAYSDILHSFFMVKPAFIALLQTTEMISWKRVVQICIHLQSSAFIYLIFTSQHYNFISQVQLFSHITYFTNKKTTKIPETLVVMLSFLYPFIW
ncbi:hypothetical protein C9J01_17485 [Photobacterium rosenbergii]|uniref:Uncharacterized protein n=1 Tax=Photobacterium rosenbergii TaxID=294936 RepID=A0A2T3NAR3_9GAMM|nr:hypothetical protein C9J01_17485 [Photobacterium rosenbergii]